MTLNYIGRNAFYVVKDTPYMFHYYIWVQISLHFIVSGSTISHFKDSCFFFFFLFATM